MIARCIQHDVIIDFISNLYSSVVNAASFLNLLNNYHSTRQAANAQPIDRLLSLVMSQYPSLSEFAAPTEYTYSDMLNASFTTHNCTPMGNAVRPISYSYSDQNSQASFYQNSLWISPNSFQSDIIHSYSQPVTADTYYEMQMIDLPLANEGSSIRPKEQILEEIVRECEEIERRSSPSSHGGSSPISVSFAIFLIPNIQSLHNFFKIF
uniref:Uncharacterized protein n=1 Tax=Heterorhabditis bacteriophora TaxID=37862 RepID=A0A1I7WWW4_HETBA